MNTYYNRVWIKVAFCFVVSICGVVIVNSILLWSVCKGNILRDHEDRLGLLAAVADQAKTDASAKLLSGQVNQEALLAEATEEIARGKKYSETRFFRSIPVIVGWSVAKEAAEREHLDFKIVALEARNPDNAPEAGGFRDRLLRDLTAQVKAGGEKTIARIDQGTNTLHYMRGIQLDESCMACHGEPQKYDTPDANGRVDGQDVLGFRMESWPVGYMHGAYEVQMPLLVVDTQVAGFFKRGMMFTVPLVVSAGGGLVVLCRVLLAKPLNNLVTIMREIAMGEGDLARPINMTRRDEIGMLEYWAHVAHKRRRKRACLIECKPARRCLR